jgi:hypothetical protein
VALALAASLQVWRTRSNGTFAIGALSGRPDPQTVPLPSERFGGETAVASSRSALAGVRSTSQAIPRRSRAPAGRQPKRSVRGRISTRTSALGASSDWWPRMPHRHTGPPLHDAPGGQPELPGLGVRRVWGRRGVRARLPHGVRLPGDGFRANRMEGPQRLWRTLTLAWRILMGRSSPDCNRELSGHSLH